MLALAVGIALLLLLPYPWNWAGLAAALVSEIIGVLYGLLWSQRDAALVGIQTLVGSKGVVVEPCQPFGRVKLRGETWRARSEVVAQRGDRVLVRSVEGLMLHVEPDQTG